MMAVLMERTLDVNSPSYSGQTPLHVAAACGHDDIVRLLLNDNAQPDISTHLSAAFNSSLVSAAYMLSCHLSSIDVLICIFR